MEPPVLKILLHIAQMDNSEIMKSVPIVLQTVITAQALINVINVILQRSGSIIYTIVLISVKQYV